jgi:hypothetical protein
MAQLGGTFDATQVAPNQPFEVLPPGKYKVQVVASEMKETKDGAGQYLWLELEILDGEFQGRKVWDRLNLVNSNQQAVEIAQRSLSALCHACGKLQVSDSEELHFIPVVATVKVRPPKGDYAASNEIRGYEAAGNVTPMARPAAASAPAAAPATNAAAPWKKRA